MIRYIWDEKIQSSSYGIFWPPNAKKWLFRKDPDAGKDWRQEEKRTREDEMVGWLDVHQLNVLESEQALGVGDGQRSLACCSPRGYKELDITEWLNWTVHVCVLTCFSHVQLFAIPWTITRQAPLSTGFFRQEYWNGLPCPSPGDIPDPGIELVSLTSSAFAGGFFTTSATW